MQSGISFLLAHVVVAKAAWIAGRSGLSEPPQGGLLNFIPAGRASGPSAVTAPSLIRYEWGSGNVKGRHAMRCSFRGKLQEAGSNGRCVEGHAGHTRSGPKRTGRLAARTKGKRQKKNPRSEAHGLQQQFQHAPLQRPLSPPRRPRPRSSEPAKQETLCLKPRPTLRTLPEPSPPAPHLFVLIVWRRNRHALLATGAWIRPLSGRAVSARGQGTCACLRGRRVRGCQGRRGLPARLGIYIAL